MVDEGLAREVINRVQKLRKQVNDTLEFLVQIYKPFLKKSNCASSS